MLVVENEKDFDLFIEKFMRNVGIFDNAPFHTFNCIFAWSRINIKNIQTNIDKDSVKIIINTSIDPTVYHGTMGSIKYYKDIANVILTLACKESGVKISYIVKSIKDDKRLKFNVQELTDYVTNKLFDKIVSNTVDINEPLKLNLNIFDEYAAWQETSIKDKCGFDIYSNDILEYEKQLDYKYAFNLKYGHILKQNGDDFSFDDVDIYDVKTGKNIPGIKLEFSTCGRVTKKLIEYYHLED